MSYFIFKKICDKTLFMGDIISHFITEWGTLGAVVFLIGYITWDNWKSGKARIDNNKETIKEVKNIKETLGVKIDNVQARIDLVDEKVDNIESNLSQKIENIQDQVDSIPSIDFEAIEQAKKDQHSKAFTDLLRLGPDLHKQLKEYNIKINGDHIFIGSFHNGNSSITGIPYYKFDIIAERFKYDKVERDTEFAHMYKDSDILRFDSLPTLLVQNDILHFDVPENGDVELSEYDDIIWRRMRGRGIKQLSLRLLRDGGGSPSGFLGVVRYDFEKIDMNELNNCGNALEKIYHQNEKLGVK